MSLIRRAVKRSPSTAIYHNSLGEAYRRHGDDKKAAHAYRQAIKRYGRYAEAYNNLSVVLRRQNRLVEARRRAETAIAINPDFAAAHNNLGIILYDMDDAAGAVVAYSRALELAPALVDAHSNIANAYRMAGRFDEAHAALRHALSLDPQHVEAHINLGAVLHLRGDLDAAIEILEKAITLDESAVDAHNNLAVSLLERGRDAEAVVALKHALALRPEFPRALNNLGNARNAQGRRVDAIACYEAALTQDPDFDAAYFSIVCNLPSVCAWDRQSRYLDELASRVQKSVARGDDRSLAGLVPVTFSLPYFSDDVETHDLALRAVAQDVIRRMSDLAGELSLTHAGSAERLRIGYMSPDFGDHPIGHVTLPVYAAHDRDKFEVYCYSLHDRSLESADFNRRIQTGADVFVDISDLSLADAARRINQDGIHILVDLTGYMLRGRPQILALRPAPIQVYWLGHGGGLGAPFVDYIIGDPSVTPPAHDSRYAEAVARLPDTFSSADRPAISDCPESRSDHDLPEQATVYCAFNNSLKIDAVVFASWMRILAAVPESVLWLNTGRDPAIRKNLSQAAANAGIDPDRLILATRVPSKDDHLARHQLADLLLDTFKFNASTTALDALWAGLPVVTKAGDTFYSRICAGYLKAVGLPELVTESVEQYEALAIRLGRDSAARQRLKARLETQRHTAPLFDAARFTASLETAYSEMWRRHVSGEPAQSFDVAAIETAK